MSALSLINVAASQGGRRVLDGVNLEVRPGEVLGVVGRNGAGKTSLLRVALGLMKLDAGTARLAGRDVASLSDPTRAALVAYLPQERRVGWNLPAWRIASLGAPEKPPALARAAALRALERVGLAGMAERGVLDLSGGERARALLARLLVTDAPLLLADEPTAGLDPDAQFMALDLLREEAAKGRAVMVTLHDLTLSVRACDRLAVLDAGRLVVLDVPEQALTPGVLRTAFGLTGELVRTAEGAVIAARRS
jgi:iron complex transport system ATP-binding protein